MSTATPLELLYDQSFEVLRQHRENCPWNTDTDEGCTYHEETKANYARWHNCSLAEKLSDIIDLLDAAVTEEQADRRSSRGAS